LTLTFEGEVMANDKFQGDWRYSFLKIDSGDITCTPMGLFHLPSVDDDGNIKDATDDDNTPLNGHVSKAGPIDVIHLNRGANPGPERHLRGILVFEGMQAGAFRRILLGERRGNPFPDNARGKGSKDENAAASQTDGTWIAVKP
jgi:hypothetical protein